MRRPSLAAIALAAALLAPACGALKDPIEPWDKSLNYEGTIRTLEAQPSVVEVDGPFGFLTITNNTPVERGFAIDELAVYEKIIPDGQFRVHVEEAKDGQRYPFYDHVTGDDDKPMGYLVVKFKKEEER